MPGSTTSVSSSSRCTSSVRPMGVVSFSVLPSLHCLYIHAVLGIGCATSVLHLDGARCNAADHQIDLSAQIYCHRLSGAFAFSHCSRIACVQSIFSPRTDARCNRVRLPYRGHLRPPWATCARYLLSPRTMPGSTRSIPSRLNI